jgi:hypothetical protein
MPIVPIAIGMTNDVHLIIRTAVKEVYLALLFGT